MQYRKQKYQPQLVLVDPARITFSPANPRQHRGSQYLRLRRSIYDIGFVQLPAVRVLPGGFYECIDGEGRVKVAQEAQLPQITAISFGIVDEQDALTMLQSANAIRSFHLLAECRGLAELHRQGTTVKLLAEKFGVSEITLNQMVGIGYFPEDIYQLIEQDIEHSEDKAASWTISLLTELLPLRQERNMTGLQQIVEHEQTKQIDEARYDYTEVRHAIRKVINGIIVSSGQMAHYAAQRRLEIFQERFDQQLHARLEVEIDLTKRSLADGFQQEIAKTKAETAKLYLEQLDALKSQLIDLEKRHATIVNEVAKRPELVAKRQAELEVKIAKAEEERKKFQTLQKNMQTEVTQLQHQIQKEKDQEYQEKEKKQRKEAEEEYKRIQKEIEATYQKKIEQHDLKVVRTVQQAMNHGIETLAEVEQSLLLLMTPDYLREISWMQTTEKVSLLAQMRVVRQTLEKAEEKLLHGKVIFASEEERNANHGSATR